ncbi:hypothetical protein L4X63_11990 [Geomonas sp. Red32]|uniref:hypothetical protein n=1 Tax=Geomonas sp. Red32 TaxID=2912856 RepID=UPI00202CDD61|nr:hypothetical protein [Geomonas sp. Red32]MCM0082310.1 hypothetical protein [Geomonas sp. Red32]
MSESENERKLPAREEIEAYIGGDGCLCLKQGPFPYEDHENIIAMCPQDVPIIIKWLQELLEEVKGK